MKKRFGILMGLLLVSLAALPAGAELITIGLTAEITDYEDRFETLSGVGVGDIITGYYTYDSLTPDTSPFSTVGTYWHDTSPSGIYLTVGGYVFQTDPDNVEFLVQIVNDHGISIKRDNYFIRSTNNLPLFGGTSGPSISWTLDDYACTALSSTTLPITPPVLEDWDSVSGITIDGGYFIRAHVTSVEIIPEPSTLLLLATGGLALLRSRKK